VERAIAGALGAVLRRAARDLPRVRDHRVSRRTQLPLHVGEHARERAECVPLEHKDGPVRVRANRRLPCRTVSNFTFRVARRGDVWVGTRETRPQIAQRGCLASGLSGRGSGARTVRIVGCSSAISPNHAPGPSESITDLCTERNHASTPHVLHPPTMRLVAGMRIGSVPWSGGKGNGGGGVGGETILSSTHRVSNLKAPLRDLLEISNSVG